MDYEIKSNVPIPIGKTSGKTAALRRLSVGDSFTIPKTELKKHTRKGVYSSAQKVGIQITTREVEEGLRVWRVEASPKTVTIKDVGKVDEHGEIVEELPEKFVGVEMNDALANFLSKVAPAAEIAQEPVDDWIYLEKPTYNEQTGKDDYFRKKPKGQWICYKSETHWD